MKINKETLSKAKLANELLRLGRLRESGEGFLELTKNNPEYSIGWQGLGLIHQKLDAHEKALICFQKAIQLDPLQAENYNSASASLRRLSKSAEALASLVTGELPNLRIPRTLCNMSALLHTSGDRHIGGLASAEGVFNVKILR
jgi:tetratricopeptide (TPR) repeat protein